MTVESTKHDAEVQDQDPYAIGTTCVVCGNPPSHPLHH